MAQGFLIPSPKRIFDADGAPAVGWKVSYVDTGTSTPRITFSDPELTSQNTDPIVTNASGYYNAFVAEAVIVDVTVTDENDVPQPNETLVSVEAMPDTSGSSPSVTAVPTGGIVAWSTEVAPTGFLLCDGSAVSRATYATLSALLAAATPTYPFGNGNGTTTFNVPDLRGKFPLGVATAGTGSTLGGSGGTIDHVHTGPSHTHAVTVTKDGWGGTQAVGTTPQGRMLASDGTVLNLTAADDDQIFTSAAGGTGNTGTANPPFIALNFIIKT